MGGFGLVASLGFVFFFSHRRVWALIKESEGGVTEIVLGGNTNRNPLGFEDKFNKIADDVRNRFAVG